MVDYHVDRPEVEAPQGVELTGTNRPEIFDYVYARRLALEVLLCAAFSAAIGWSSGSPSRWGSSFWRP